MPERNHTFLHSLKEAALERAPFVVSPRQREAHANIRQALEPYEDYLDKLSESFKNPDRKIISRKFLRKRAFTYEISVPYKDSPEKVTVSFDKNWRCRYLTD